MNRKPWTPEAREKRMAALAAKKLQEGSEWSKLLRKSQKLAKEIEGDYQTLMGFLSEIRRRREIGQATQ